MVITEIPFNKHLGMSISAEDQLQLQFTPILANHLNTFHAGAQFALAEACSGKLLQNQFPELEDSVMPVIRKADVKFKKPARDSILAKAKIASEEIEKFKEQFDRKGRATITVPVEIKDINGKVTMSGTYEWFVQSI